MNLTISLPQRKIGSGGVGKTDDVGGKGWFVGAIDVFDVLEVSEGFVLEIEQVVLGR